MFSTFFALHGTEVTGVDVSEQALKVARLRAAVSLPPGAAEPRFARVAVEHLSREFARGSFDIAFGFAVAHHFDQSLFPGEVDWVLAEGGLLVLYEPTPHSALLQRIRVSGIVTKVAPVGRHTECEEPFYRSTVVALSRLFVMEEYPCRSVMMAVAEMLVIRSKRFTALINTLLRAFPVDVRWPEGGCGAKHRLNRLDRSLLLRVPWLRPLCRTSIIVARKLPGTN